MNTPKQPDQTLIKLSQQILYAVKMNEETTDLQRNLSALTLEDLVKALPDDKFKNCFWINIYNAFTQIKLKDDDEAYADKNKFFTTKNILIARQKISLDDIEHGYLRRSKNKKSLGYLGKLFPGSTEKKLRVATPDYRVHFALNCGAASCPPIAFYSPEKLNQQLDLATQSYLEAETFFNRNKKVIELPAIMSWFRADFGGIKGMFDILKKYHLISMNEKPAIVFKQYNWTKDLNNFSEE